MKASKKTESYSPGALTWWWGEARLRVTAWPQIRFERQGPNGWVELEASLEADALEHADIRLSSWERYLRDLPMDLRSFVECFRECRLPALQVALRCPTLLPALLATPALGSFLAHHASLRGTQGARWSEIEAVFERGGIYGLLEWLGLPSSRQTLAVLGHLISPDLSLRLLEALRESLWEPETITSLAKVEMLSSRQVAFACHTAHAA